jgi:hypothetical protein
MSRKRRPLVGRTLGLNNGIQMKHLEHATVENMERLARSLGINPASIQPVLEAYSRLGATYPTLLRLYVLNALAEDRRRAHILATTKKDQS